MALLYLRLSGTIENQFVRERASKSLNELKILADEYDPENPMGLHLLYTPTGGSRVPACSSKECSSPIVPSIILGTLGILQLSSGVGVIQPLPLVA